MKKVSLTTVLLLSAFVLMISSCGKKSDSTSVTSKVNFTSGGTNYSYPSSGGLVGIRSANSINLSSADPSGANNQLILVGANNASGTYPFSLTTSMEWLINSKIYYSNSTGSVSINISGSTATVTFNATLYNTLDATDSVVITNGNYSGKYFAS